MPGLRGFSRLPRFACRSFESVTSYRRAMPQSVSWRLTTCVAPVAGTLRRVPGRRGFSRFPELARRSFVTVVLYFFAISQRDSFRRTMCVAVLGFFFGADATLGIDDFGTAGFSTALEGEASFTAPGDDIGFPS